MTRIVSAQDDWSGTPSLVMAAVIAARQHRGGWWCRTAACPAAVADGTGLRSSRAGRLAMIGMVVVDIRERMRYRDGPNGRLRSGFIALGKSFRITAILKGQKNSALWAVNDEPCWFDSSPGHVYHSGRSPWPRVGPDLDSRFGADLQYRGSGEGECSIDACLLIVESDTGGEEEIREEIR